MTKLVILESPGKIRKVTQLLKEIDQDNTYIVKASIGHIRELDDSGPYQIGLDLKTIAPNFSIIKNKFKIVKEIIEVSKNVDEVILATDIDREGEVIAWHLYEILKPYNKNFKRLRLNAITKECVRKELDNLGEINMNYVNAGLARSYLDKITGYIISKVLQNNSIGVSAGRVQSAVLKILVNRENEIEKFKKEKWYILQDDLEVTFKNVNSQNNNYEIAKHKTMNLAMNIKQQLNNHYIVDKIIKTKFKDKFFVNFTTSTYLQAAKNKLKLKVKDALKIAQSLFEKGLITYIRTGSSKLNEEIENQLKNYVLKKYGSNNLGKIHSRKSKNNTQEAHLPIIPTNFELEPQNIQDFSNEFLLENEIKVYDLIWKNTINSALKQPSGNNSVYILENNRYYFLGEAKEYLDFGYYNFDKSLIIPKSQSLQWKKEQKINVCSLQIIKQSTTVQARFNEATLIKELENLAIGRPSTYKSSVEVNQIRNYVNIKKGGKEEMFVTKGGTQVNEFLAQNFGDFINLEFTKNMERKLDLIAKGQIDYKKYVKNYYSKLEKAVTDFMVAKQNIINLKNDF